MTAFHQLAILLTVAMLAGCTTSSSQDQDSEPLVAQGESSGTETLETPADDIRPTPASSNETEKPEPALEWRSVQVYASSGWVVAASPGHPLESGALIDDLQPVRQDTFLAPPGTIEFDVTVRDLPFAIRSGGIEIYDSTGALVYANGPLLGWNVPFSTGCGRCINDLPEQAVGPGLYTVAYYMVGAAVHMTVMVDAIVASASSMAEGGQAASPIATAADGRENETAIEPREVYSSSGFIVGAAPAHPLEDGPLVEDSPTHREDMFLAPPGTVALDVSPYFPMGAWSGGIEIVHESGVVVYRKEYVVAGQDGGLGGCVRGHCGVEVGRDYWAADTAPAGNYTVAYRFVGAVYGAVTVDAIVED